MNTSRKVNDEITGVSLLISLLYDENNPICEAWARLLKVFSQQMEIRFLPAHLMSDNVKQSNFILFLFKFKSRDKVPLPFGKLFVFLCFSNTIFHQSALSMAFVRVYVCICVLKLKNEC